MKPFQYLTNCVDCGDGDAINTMKEHAIDVTLATMVRHCDGIQQWAKEHGYGRDFPLSRDWAVDYKKGCYKGDPCYFIRWSGIEFIWIRRNPLSV